MRLYVQLNIVTNRENLTATMMWLFSALCFFMEARVTEGHASSVDLGRSIPLDVRPGNLDHISGKRKVFNHQNPKMGLLTFV